MTRVYKEVEVEFDLADLEDEELIKELKSRNLPSFNSQEILNEIWLCRKLSVPYEHLVDKLIYETLGKII